jgi:hypothetical protein
MEAFAVPVVVLLPLAVRQVTTRSLGGRCVKGLPALSVPLVSMDYPLHWLWEVGTRLLEKYFFVLFALCLPRPPCVAHAG